MSYHKYSRNLFVKQQQNIIRNSIDLAYVSSFVDAYQSRMSVEHPRLYSFETLRQASDNSESLFEQYPLDEKNVKAIAKSIFVESGWLKRDIEIANIGGVLYIVGGRHRLSALLTTFSQLSYTGGNSEEEREELFEQYLNLECRVTEVVLQTTTDLLSLIEADNDSRAMRKAESVHLLSQRLGAKSTESNTIVGVALRADLTPKVVKDVCGQHFARQTHETATKQTRQLLGERIAQHIIYGTDKLTARSKMCVSSIAEVEEKMDVAWTIAKQVIAESDTPQLARNVKLLSEAVIAKFDAAYLVDDVLPVVQPSKNNATVKKSSKREVEL